MHALVKSLAYYLIPLWAINPSNPGIGEVVAIFWTINNPPRLQGLTSGFNENFFFFFFLVLILAEEVTSGQW